MTAPPSDPGLAHAVATGETIASIAASYNLPVARLRQANQAQSEAPARRAPVEQDPHFFEAVVTDPDGNPIVGEPLRGASDSAPPRDVTLGESGVRVENQRPGQRRALLPRFEFPIEPPGEDHPPVPAPKVPRLFSARWDRSRARWGADVKLAVEHADFDPGTVVIFRSYRSDTRSPDDVEAVEKGAVAGDKIEATWTYRRPAEASGPHRPARFYFVAAGDVEARSGTIEFPDTVAIEARTKHGGPAAARRFRLKFPTGEKLEGALDAAGKAQFEDVPPGAYEVVFLCVDALPRHAP